MMREEFVELISQDKISGDLGMASFAFGMDMNLRGVRGPTVTGRTIVLKMPTS